MSKCRGCDLPIASGARQLGCKRGIHWHILCYDLNIASLAEELRSYARSPDSGLEELPDGRFKKKTK